ncbi:hypothetical protein [Cohnella sp.]|uniref:hypothetical protein n=1 Tax=Cohnella sp. TaxID=1883426 RepID=UPI00356523BB
MTEEQLKGLSALLDEKIHPLQSQLDSQGDLLTQLVKMVAGSISKLDNMNRDIAGLIEGQERQDRILELLSARSIEQESVLNKFKNL